MPQVTVTVLVEVDGQPVSGFPLTTRLQTDQVVPWNPVWHLADAPGTYVAVPAPTIEGLKALILRPDAAISVRFAAQSDAGLTIGPHGLLIALDCDVTTGAETNASVSAAADTAIRGLAAGVSEV
jgi:hypothetical protein